jgi:hypothetical protein
MGERKVGFTETMGEHEIRLNEKKTLSLVEVL